MLPERNIPLGTAIIIVSKVWTWPWILRGIVPVMKRSEAAPAP